MGRSSGRSGGSSHSSSHRSSSFSSSRSSHSFSSGRSSSPSSHRSNYSGGSSYKGSSYNSRPSYHYSNLYPNNGKLDYDDYNYNRRPYRNTYRSYNNGTSGCLPGLVIFIIVLIGFLIFLYVLSGMISSDTKSTVLREKVQGYEYKEIIIDHTNELSNGHSKLSQAMRDFYDKTGVVPIIYLSSYSDYNDISTDELREKYANDVFDKYADHEASFLVMGFESEEDLLELNYTTTIVGHSADSVLDDEALNIFEAYFRQAWDNEDLSMDEVFIEAFTKTANRIMQKSTTITDVFNSIIKVLGIVIVVMGIITVITIIHRRKQKENEEIQQILSTPLDKSDSTLEKYE